MTRLTLGTLFGLAPVILVVGVTDRLGMILYPMPVSIDWADQAARAYEPWNSPSGARRLMAVGWFAQALVGAALAVVVARRRAAAVLPIVMAWGCAIGSIAMSAPPVWMGWAAMLLPIVGGLLGICLARVRSARARP